jgi:hypothetical protein
MVDSIKGLASTIQHSDDVPIRDCRFDVRNLVQHSQQIRRDLAVLYSVVAVFRNKYIFTHNELLSIS